MDKVWIVVRCAKPGRGPAAAIQDGRMEVYEIVRESKQKAVNRAKQLLEDNSKYNWAVFELAQFLLAKVKVEIEDIVPVEGVGPVQAPEAVVDFVEPLFAFDEPHADN